MRRLPQSTVARHVALRELPLGLPKMLLGLALTARAAQQSNQCGLDHLVGWFEETERPRMRQGFLRHALEARYQRCGKQTRSISVPGLAASGRP